MRVLDGSNADRCYRVKKVDAELVLPAPALDEAKPADPAPDGTLLKDLYGNRVDDLQSGTTTENEEDALYSSTVPEVDKAAGNDVQGIETADCAGAKDPAV